MGKYYNALSWAERLKIECLHEAGFSDRDIAEQLGRNRTTIWRELKRGKYKKRTSDWREVESYSADIAQEKYEYNASKRGTDLKIGNNHKAVKYIEKLIIDGKYSPYAAAIELKKNAEKYGIVLCFRTIYSYIDMGIFMKLKLSDLPTKSKPKRKKRKIQKRAAKGKSIEQRPLDIDSREEFGHWEMDTVIGKKEVSKKTLLVLTERKTRKEICLLMKDRTSKSVVNKLNLIEKKIGKKRFSKIFKSITVDNGSEFMDYEGMRHSKKGDSIRTEIFYCHPYSAYERGSNENQNKLVRRFVPKGADLNKYSQRDISKITDWINNYPRRIFGGETANIRFERELAVGLL